MILCPDCSTQIPDNDLNVGTDIAYCRICKKAHKFSVINESVDIADFNVNAKPKDVKIVSTDRSLIVEHHRINKIVLFLIPFMCLWSGMSMALIYVVPIMKGKLDLFGALFGMPFLFGTIAMLIIIIFCLFGKTKLSLTENTGEVFIGVGKIGWRRSFSLNDVVGVSIVNSKVFVNHQAKTMISIKYKSGLLFGFGVMLTDDVKEYMAKILKKTLLTRR